MKNKKIIPLVLVGICASAFSVFLAQYIHNEWVYSNLFFRIHTGIYGLWFGVAFLIATIKCVIFAPYNEVLRIWHHMMMSFGRIFRPSVRKFGIKTSVVVVPLFIFFSYHVYFETKGFAHFNFFILSILSYLEVIEEYLNKIPNKSPL